MVEAAEALATYLSQDDRHILVDEGLCALAVLDGVSPESLSVLLAVAVVEALAVPLAEVWHTMVPLVLCYRQYRVPLMLWYLPFPPGLQRRAAAGHGQAPEDGGGGVYCGKN